MHAHSLQLRPVTLVRARGTKGKEGGREGGREARRSGRGPRSLFFVRICIVSRFCCVYVYVCVSLLATFVV